MDRKGYDQLDEKETASTKAPPQRGNCCWVFLKIITAPLFFICLPYLTLDIFLDDFFHTHCWVVAWHFLDTSDSYRKVYFRAIRESWMRWGSGLLLLIGVWAYPMAMLYDVWPYEPGKDSSIWLIRTCFLVPTVVSVFVIFRVTMKNKDYSQIDFPSRGIRFRNWQNWVALASIVYDLFTLMSLFVRPEVPYPKNTHITAVFSESWQHIGIDSQAFTFWLAFSLGFLWMGIALYALIMIEAFKDETRGLTNPYMIFFIPLLTNSGFLFITVNLLNGLVSYSHVGEHATTSFLSDYSEGVQLTITLIALQTLTYYGTSAMLYGGVLNAKSDNIFVDPNLDIRFKQSYFMVECLLKQILAASNIFTKGKTELLTTSLSVSLVICTVCFALNVWQQPCCLYSINILKEGQFAFLIWGSVCSLIATTQFSSAATTVSDSYIPIIILLIGWAAIAIVCVIRYRIQRGQEKDRGLFVWGFLPPNHEAEMWWRAAVPTHVELPEVRWSTCSSGGAPFTFAVTQDGTVYNTGINDRGQLGHRDDTYRYGFSLLFELWDRRSLVKKISCGGEHVLILTYDGALWSVGRGDFGQLGLGDTNDRHCPQELELDVEVVQISAGEFHSAFVSNEGEVYTWGEAKDGRLGHGEAVDQPLLVPKKITGIREATDVNCGGRHTAILLDNGSAYMFGDNTYGQLGLGDVQTRYRPTLLTADTGYVAFVSCGGEHTLLLTRTGVVFAFGRGHCGQLGLNSIDNSLTPQRIKGDDEIVYKWISAGFAHSAVVTEDGLLYTFGSGLEHCNGNPFGHDLLVPTLIEHFEGELIKEVSCGRHHSTAITLSDQLWTWGTSNAFCGLGYSPTHVCTVPTYREIPLNPGEYMKKLNLGLNHMMLVTSQGRLIGSGASEQGQLGLSVQSGFSSFNDTPLIDQKDDHTSRDMKEKDSLLRTMTNKNLTVPKVVPAFFSTKVKDVSCGFWYTAVITEDGQCWTFGKGDEGQLGHGETVKSLGVPTRIARLKGVFIKRVSCGYCHTIASTIDGKVYAWGSNGSAIDKFYGNTLPPCRGLLGGYDEKGPENAWVPIVVPGLDGYVVKAVSTNFAHNAAVTDEGLLLTWGFGYFGVLGHGDRMNQTRPKVIESLVQEHIKVAWVACGVVHTVLVTDDGMVYTHGMGGHAQLGHGTTEWKLTPTLVQTLADTGTKATYISAGTYQSAAVMENGHVYIWGSYLLGALGLGDIYRHALKPTIVGNLLFSERFRKVECGNHIVAAMTD